MAAHDSAAEPGHENKRRESAEHGAAEGQADAVRLRLVLPKRNERCDFESLALGKGKYRHTCKRCGISAVTNRPNCVALCEKPLPEGEMPSLAKRAINFKEAYQRWEAAGKPTRSDEQVQEIFDQHCEPCQYFTGSACKLCGCLVSRERHWMNKLRWATEQCPLDPPRWKAEVGVQ